MVENIPPHVYAQAAANEAGRAADSAAQKAKINTGALEHLVTLLQANGVLAPHQAVEVMSRLQG